MKLEAKLIVDDYQGQHESDHETIGEAFDMIRTLERDGYDVLSPTLDGVRIERTHNDRPILRGWQHCNACGSTHPVSSEC